MFEESGSFIPSIWASMNSWFTPTVLFVFLNLMIGTIAITSSLATKKGNDQQKQQQQQQQEHYGGGHHHHHHHHQQHQPQQLARSPSMLQRLKSINFYNYRSHEPNTNFAQTNSVTNSHFTNHFSYEQEQEQQQEEEEPQHQHQYQQTPQLGRSPSMLQRLKSFNLYNYLSSQDSAADTHFTSNQEQEREQEQEHHLEPEQDEEEEGEEEEEEDRFQDQEQSLEDIYSQLRGNKAAARTKSDMKPASGEILKKLPKKMKKSASSKSAFNHFKKEDIVEVEARRPATTKENGYPKVTQVDDEGVDAKADDFINNFRHQLKLQRTASIIRYREMINRGAGK